MASTATMPPASWGVIPSGSASIDVNTDELSRLNDSVVQPVDGEPDAPPASSSKMEVDT